MKQNPCPVVGEVTKATGIGLDELDSTVESFGAGVADACGRIVRNTGTGQIDSVNTTVTNNLRYFMDVGDFTTGHKLTFFSNL